MEIPKRLLYRGRLRSLRGCTLPHPGKSFRPIEDVTGPGVISEPAESLETTVTHYVRAMQNILITQSNEQVAAKVPRPPPSSLSIRTPYFLVVVL